ncbi:DUF1097 domain-containing protein [Paraburkholderia caribensis]|uniref:DUF1097 domain-containing protein n=1 Tax=Paraburkholderia TaxID=1822464 RepID=UPI001CB3791F|nr:DUF1097 domain-containing protein [Paraburkholderia caribensis]BEU25607.1 DUF1097 domain-containing protein [Paraburkholderia sp. 22B1P]CAG9262543.1 conserved membrane hypothetical protein [Paraburkholderia caribensis]
MSTLVSLALSVAILGGIATWLFLAVGTILIWAAFTAWACFFHSGGNAAALRSTIISNAFGVVVASTTGLIIVAVPGARVFGGPIWASLVVAVSIAVYILAARISWFSSIPGTTYGYACTFAFLTQNPEKFSVKALTSFNLGNAYLVVTFSMIIGALFAFVSGRLSKVLQHSETVDA